MRRASSHDQVNCLCGESGPMPGAEVPLQRCAECLSWHHQACATEFMKRRAGAGVGNGSTPRNAGGGAGMGGVFVCCSQRPSAAKRLRSASPVVHNGVLHLTPLTSNPHADGRASPMPITNTNTITATTTTAATTSTTRAATPGAPSFAPGAYAVPADTELLHSGITEDAVAVPAGTPTPTPTTTTTTTTTVATTPVAPGLPRHGGPAKAVAAVGKVRAAKAVKHLPVESVSDSATDVDTWRSSQYNPENDPVRTGWSAGTSTVDIPRNEIELVYKLSKEGVFGEVWAGRCRGCPVAIKVPKISADVTPAKRKEKLDGFRAEIRILSTVQHHPHICLYMGAHISNDRIWIITELLHGDLDTYIREHKGRVSPYEKVLMLRDAARGMAWLHAQKPRILHRDLKPTNVLFLRTGQRPLVRVCDFGLSDLMGSADDVTYDHEPKGSPLYMAPEVLAKKAIDGACDIWSWAITLWEILMERDPYHREGVRTVDQLRKFVMSKQTLTLPQNVHGQHLPKSLIMLLRDCWAFEPHDRPTFQDIISQLDSRILVEVAVTDGWGRNFWRKYLGCSDTASFSRFANAFFKVFNLGKTPTLAAAVEGYDGNAVQHSSATRKMSPMYHLNVLCLRLIRVLFVLPQQHQSDAPEVSLEHFGRCLRWVGPLEQDFLDFLQRMQGLLGKPWFWAYMVTSEASNQLAYQPGAFLVRFCNTLCYPGYYVLSHCTHDDVVLHKRIQRTANGGFSLEVDPLHVYGTLQDLIDANRLAFGLQQACVGRSGRLRYFEGKSVLLDRIRSMVRQGVCPAVEDTDSSLSDQEEEEEEEEEDDEGDDDDDDDEDAVENGEEEEDD